MRILLACLILLSAQPVAACVGLNLDNEFGADLPTGSEIRAAYNQNIAPQPALPTQIAEVFVNAVDPEFDQFGLRYTELSKRAAQWITPCGLTKAQQLGLSGHLADTLSREEVVKLYLEKLYFGRGCRGVAQAARAYFRQPPEQLTIAQTALLAAIAQAPHRNDPVAHPQNAKRQRDAILTHLHDQGLLSPQDHRPALNTPLMIAEPLSNCPIPDDVTKDTVSGTDL
ncbi:transglycosylase domain-containing protein [Thalassobius sp. MITS945101]|uniref:transglycosylase domain-containing protein n=1 Tax=Thalassobius sp. MITS945101 TaxID=3096994 RepID=UPI00399BCFF0